MQRNRQRDVHPEILEAITAIAVRSDQLGSAAIRRELEKSDHYKELLPPQYTLERVVRDVRRVQDKAPDSVKGLDRPFEWRKMGGCIPWEASSYLLEMWAWVRESGPFPTTNMHFPLPSMRDVGWWWRIHQAAPDLSMKDIWYFAQHFSVREMAISYLNVPTTLDDLQAILAYKPWESPEKKRIYWEAVEAGRIPAPRHISPEIATRLREELPKHQDRLFISILLAERPIIYPEEGVE